MYTAEAHATDEWPISSGRSNGGRGPVALRQHRDTAERCAAARAFAAAFGITDIPVLVDPMPEQERDEQAAAGGRPSDGVFDAALAPWPVRFYVFDSATRQLLYASEPRAASLDPWELRGAVEAELGRRGVRWGSEGAAGGGGLREA